MILLPSVGCCTQGIPDTGNSADPVARELENFFDLFGEERAQDSPGTSVPFHFNAQWQRA